MEQEFLTFLGCPTNKPQCKLSVLACMLQQGLHFITGISIVRILQKVVFTTDFGQEQKEAAVFAGYSFALKANSKYAVPRSPIQLSFL